MNAYVSLAIGVFMSSLAGAMGGEDTNRLTCEVMEFGTYSVLAQNATVRSPDELDKQELPVHIVTLVKFLDHTNEIVAQKGTGFGFRYKMTGLPDGPIVLDFETVHPPFTLPDGKKDFGRVVHGECDPKAGEWKSTMGYHFDEDFEMVEGDWVMSVCFNNKKLITQTFHVKTVSNQ